MLLFPLLISILTLSSSSELLYQDHVYEAKIKTVRLYPTTDNPDGKMLPPITAPNAASLQLEFDDLQANRTNYYVRVISCNYDWTPSRLHDLDFLHDYNEFTVNDYTYSSNTRIPYIHYQFLIPSVKIPGNYLLVVYRDGDKDDMILSKRFMVSSRAVTIKREANFGMNALHANTQQVNFILDYNGLDIPNPLETVNVIIRQNQRWDNAHADFKPSFVREGNKTLEYRFFNNENSFKAGNEFRFVDFRSLNSPGQNTARLVRDNKPYRLYVATDAPRADQRYAQFTDLNGNYAIVNYDMGSGETSSNYVNVIFTLQSARAFNSKVYVMGAFNNWAKDPANEMNFKDGQYTGEVQLKQGFYNYCYETNSPTESIEGNYFETENEYEILVYNHAYFPEADMLVGYYAFRMNPR